jgi:hypothetical protein
VPPPAPDGFANAVSAAPEENRKENLNAKAAKERKGRKEHLTKVSRSFFLPSCFAFSLVFLRGSGECL